MAKRREAMIDTVILDWSGVVSDDLEAVWLTSNDILKERGAKPVSLQQFRELFELPFMNFYKKHLIDPIN